jgi:alkylhydroperoxidase family enzyme
MRLSVLDNGHRLRARLFLAITGRISRVDPPDIVRMLLYRPEFMTRPLLDLTAEAMRGDSCWTPAEREYLAMCTAQHHRCPYCVDTHTEMIRIAAHGEIDPDNLAAVRPQLRAVRELLDGTATGGADLSDHAVAEALRVRLVWDIVNRLANAFGFDLRAGHLHSGTRALHRFGYRLPGFLLGGGDRRGDPIEALRHTVLNAPGRTDPVLRQAAATGGPLPTPWGPYVTLVRDASYRITDADVAALTAAGLGEDEIFEITVAAAVGAALAEFDAGRRALLA